MNKNHTKKKPEWIVLSVGGSLIVPDQIDTDFLKNFKKLINRNTKRGFSFAIICGGGKTARRYQAAAKTVSGSLTAHDVDWIGIHSTRLNAHLLRTIFYKEAKQEIIKNPTLPVKTSKQVLIAAGWEPGCSTDFDAVLLAKNLGAKKMVNLSNIDYVYTADPRKDKKATPIKEMAWKEFRQMIPKKWDPGLSSPFDPIASKEAEKLDMEVVIMNGEKLENLQKYLDSKPFIGTKIS